MRKTTFTENGYQVMSWEWQNNAYCLIKIKANRKRTRDKTLFETMQYLTELCQGQYECIWIKSGKGKIFTALITA